MDHSTNPPWNWGHGFIPAVRELRKIRSATLVDTLDFMATIFGFPNWHEWRPWLRENEIDFTMVKGPHAFTILKAIAAKHDRLNVSVQP